ncbi:hypothetical protein BEL04_17965 [Mucilaginibacter sp. PPCGB 2223]|uniref:hypothetical protein n=1 Tax=Mucilaginibacter sp. PPCGB 2223 TaxID=1886027 RepID=UPI00082718DB|nr:hypothetical protein [Mucilaginibacter sp. PPCGB 2223]OCX51890.1 hypothetical protein BEL04_17965 [Mucilaginibacter sp. PPCGB 2223]
MVSNKKLNTCFLAGAVIVLLLSCNLPNGKQELNLCCPGLKINISGITYAYSNGLSFEIFTYDNGSQKQVQDYFTKKENGFTPDKNKDLYDLKEEDNALIDKNDSIVGKTIPKKKGKAEVVFNASTRRIIIIEYSDK